MAGFFFVTTAGKRPGAGSVYDLHLAVLLETFAEVKKFMLKLKLGTRGRLGILGIWGIRKLDLSCKESLIALTREFTCSW